MVAVLLLAAVTGMGGGASVVSVRSPNGALALTVGMGQGRDEAPQWSATFHGKALLAGCRLSLSTNEDGDIFAGARNVDARTRSVRSRIPILFGKADHVEDRYNELRLSLESRMGRRIHVLFRCYDDAIAFRYEVPKQKGRDRLIVSDEGTSFGIPGNPVAHVQYLENYQTSHEHNVTSSRLAQVAKVRLLDMPATFLLEGGGSLAITEAALSQYAGMSLMRPTEAAELVCRLTPLADGSKVIAPLPMKSPWRVVMVGEQVGDLLESNVLYCLNDSPRMRDTSWIKPGKMTWPWWNGNLFDDTPSLPILSLEMAKKYIDFCAANGIAFHSVIADETDTPWYRQPNKGLRPLAGTDATKARVDLDLPGILRYANSKGVRLWTWVHQAALRGRVEQAFAEYEKLGWSGMMVDFFDHDDQESVEHAEAILEAAARHYILIHFHGIWKPTGRQRTYPNLMNHEGALNLEYLKWGMTCTPDHDLNLAFTRLVAGPMDYHLGGFRAVSKSEFKPRVVGPNVLGTRARQLAMYVCFDNPNPMVADYPAAYAGQAGFEFIKDVPTWWDETRVLAGEVGRLLVTARRKGRVWYVGGLAAGPPQDIELPLGFLGPGGYSARIWKDPIASSDPNQLAVETLSAKATDRLKVRVAEDGGFAAKFTPEKARR